MAGAQTVFNTTSNHDGRVRSKKTPSTIVMSVLVKLRNVLAAVLCSHAPTEEEAAKMGRPHSKQPLHTIMLPPKLDSHTLTFALLPH